jgi:hypothetical protein
MAATPGRVRHGIPPVDVDGDGIDELAMLKRGRGDETQMDLYRLGLEESPILASGTLESMDGPEIVAMAHVPPDLTYPPGCVALLYREGSTFIVRLARVHVSGETVHLEPIGPTLLPHAARESSVPHLVLGW